MCLFHVNITSRNNENNKLAFDLLRNRNLNCILSVWCCRHRRRCRRHRRRRRCSRWCCVCWRTRACPFTCIAFCLEFRFFSAFSPPSFSSSSSSSLFLILKRSMLCRVLSHRTEVKINAPRISQTIFPRYFQLESNPSNDDSNSMSDWFEWKKIGKTNARAPAPIRMVNEQFISQSIWMWINEQKNASAIGPVMRTQPEIGECVLRHCARKSQIVNASKSCQNVSRHPAYGP